MKWIKFLVSGAVLALLAWRTDWARLATAFAGLRLNFWLAAVGLYVLTQVVSAVRWQMLSRPLGFEQPLSHYVGFYFIGMFFNLFLPTSVGGDVVRAWYLAADRRQRFNGVLSVLVDRGSGLLVLIALACVALLFCPVELPEWVSWSVWTTAGSAGLGLALLYLFARVARKTVRTTGLAHKINVLHEVFLGRPGLLVTTTLLSVIVQGANVVLAWLVGLALDLPVPALYYAIAVPMVTLLTLLPSINGMGLREGGLVLFLAPLGVAPEAALTLSFLWFAVFATTSLMGGLVYLFGRFPRPGEHAEHGSVSGGPDQGRAGQLGAAA
jgi:uncharacterized membrane protein YbhN (UPF0104 family)